MIVSLAREEPAKSPWFSLNHISHLATVEIRVVRLGSFQNLYLSFAIVEITHGVTANRDGTRFPPCKASNLIVRGHYILHEFLAWLPPLKLRVAFLKSILISHSWNNFIGLFGLVLQLVIIVPAWRYTATYYKFSWTWLGIISGTPISPSFCSLIEPLLHIL